MKKFLPLFLFLCLVAGCGQPSVRYEPFVPPEPTGQSTSTIVVKTEPSFDTIQPDTLVVTDPDFGSKLINSLAKFPLVEVAKPKTPFVNSEFLPRQLTRVFRTGDILVGLVQHASMNTFLDDHVPTTTGVWQADVSSSTLLWKPWLEITNSDWPENNPFFVWGDEEVLKVLLVNNRGAGSGEGTAKVIVSRDGGNQWQTERCFYYVPENFPYFMSGEIVRSDLEVDMKKNLPREAKFNSATGQFEVVQWNKYTGREETSVDARCADIVLP